MSHLQDQPTGEGKRKVEKAQRGFDVFKYSFETFDSYILWHAIHNTGWSSLLLATRVYN